MAKRTSKNPLGAGRKENEWTSTRRTIPDALWPEVKILIDSWKAKQKGE